MKSVKLSLLLSCASTSFTLAQTPDSINQKFRNEYPRANDVQWKADRGIYRAAYRDENNIQRSVYYDNQGRITRKQYQVSATDVPGTISDYYAKTYPQETNYQVWGEDDNQGRKAYFINRKTETLYFDQKGNFMRSKNVRE